MKAAKLFLVLSIVFYTLFAQPFTGDTLFTDIDGDGDLDQLISGSDGSRFYLKNLGDGRYADVLVQPSSDSQAPAFYPANPDSQYFMDETVLRLPEIYELSLTCDVGDLDGDGDLDIIVGNRPVQNRVLINNGNGFFTAEDSRIPLQYQDTRAVPVGDVDNDGDLDIYVSNHKSGAPNLDYSDRIWINDGTGFFTDERDSRLPLTDSLSIGGRFGDFNNDGWLDLFLGHSGSNIYNLVYINDGEGNFSDQSTDWLPEDRWGLYIYVLDINQDWNLDILLGNSEDQIRILINDGLGSLIDETAERFPENPIYAMSVAIGDVDSDSDLDIFFASGDGYLWINNNGYFSDESSLRLPEYNSIHSGRGVTMADIDSDGDLDIFIGTFNMTPQLLYVNDGNGYFSDVSDTRLPPVNSSVEDAIFLDADTDGDMDIFLACDGDLLNRLFINHSPVSDTIPPIINRTMYPPQLRDSSLVIQAEVWDNMLYFQEILLYYKTYGDTGYVIEQMWEMEGNLYRFTLPNDENTGLSYYIKATDFMGNFVFDPPGAPDSVYFFNWSVGVKEEQFSDVNSSLFSLQTYPNPFNNTLHINVDIDRTFIGDIIIYDILGKKVKSLSIGSVFDKGNHTFIWDGISEDNKLASNGIYFIVLIGNENAIMKSSKIVMIK